jgi:protein-tyrosine phosphatase
MRIAVVCMGNICRSPMGEVVLRAKAAEKGLDIEVCSGGTGPWHVGDGAHPQSVKVLAEAGYDGSAHRARQITPEWIDRHDLLLVMDRANLSAVRALADTDEQRAKVHLLREYDPQGGEGTEVPDPFGLPIDEYRSVLAMVERSVEGLLVTLG